MLFSRRIILQILILSLILVFLLIAVENRYYTPASWRIILFGLLFLSVAAVVFLGLWRFARDYGGLDDVARAIDSRFPHFKNRLESAMEFAGPGVDGDNFSPELAEAAVKQAARLVNDGSTVMRLVHKVVDRLEKKARFEEYLASGLTIVFLIFSITDPLGIYRIIQNYSHPLDSLRRERSFRLYANPGNKTILRGESLTVKGFGSIWHPEEMRINFWQAGKAKEAQPMSYRADQFEYYFTFSNIENDISYYLEQGKSVTDTFRIQVTNNPFVTELFLRYEFPQYSGLPPYETSKDKSIQALYGTRVIINGRASNPLVQAQLVFGPDSMRQMKIFKGRDFTDSLIIKEDGGYRICLTDCWGLTNTDTMSYPITVIKDERPAIVLKFPGEEAQLDENMKQPLIFEVSDDFGISSIQLIFQKERPSGQISALEKRNIALYAKPETHLLGQYLWDLSALSLIPQDAAVYHLQAFDNDRLSGPKSAVTPDYRIRFPSLEEIFEQEQKRQDKIAGDLEKLEEQGQKLRDQMKEMSLEIERGQKMEWEEKQRLEQAISQQTQITNEVKELAGQLQQSIQQMERGEMVSRELIEKMTQVQKLMEEVTTAEMKEALKKIQQAVDKLDRKEVMEAMDRFKITQEQILEKLDKTIALLSKIKLEQQMDFLVNKSQELSEKARELRDTTASLLGAPRSEEEDDTTKTARERNEIIDKEKAGEVESPAESSTIKEEDKSPESLLKNDLEKEKNLLAEQSRVPEKDKKPAAAGKKDTGEEIKGEIEPRKLDELETLVKEIAEQTAELFGKITETSQGMDQAGEKELAGKLKDEGAKEKKETYANQFSEISGSLNVGKFSESMRGERQMSGNLNKLHQRMEDYREELKAEWKQQVAEAMLRAFENLDYLSERQEKILDSFKNEPDVNHPEILAYADQQQEVVEGLELVRNSLLEAARDNFFISFKLLSYLEAAVERGMQSVSELGAEVRKKDTAWNELQSSLALINAGMVTLLQDRENMEQSASATGMDKIMAQLEELAKRQEKLNQMMENAYSNSGRMPSDGASIMPPAGVQGQSLAQGDLIEMLRRMAAEQQAIRDQIARIAEQMAGKKELPGSSSMEGTARDADEVIKDMLDRGVTQETFNRQRKILDRLLDAQRSIQERDSGKKRISERPGQYTIQPPESLNRDLLNRADEESLLKSILEHWKGTYPESFEPLIRNYFERLKMKNLEN